ncbi:MAG: 2-vinyl bacteriochlorophyllide hydratase [Betaproteobacteria bacterium TMED156]|nr:MAG: 2-vinyl bacteriochlorophyllide hydratase [Betaproteobacteria bacterium TMED156]
MTDNKVHSNGKGLLYTKEERERRDKTAWTFVQGVLAPVQFVVFLVSLALVLNYFINETWESLALISVVLKTIILYMIMVTGSIWEKVVFGKYLFAKPFFWEDLFSMLVLFLHSLYLVSLFIPALSTKHQLAIAVAAYIAYLINAIQFLIKFRIASVESHSTIHGVTP